MKFRSLPAPLLSLTLGSALLAPSAPSADGVRERAAFWVDLVTAQPLRSADDLWQDLATVDIVFVGETHRLARHHALQQEIVSRLLATGRPLVLGLEQIETRNQPELDQLNRGEIDFVQFAERIRWKDQWDNYQDYRDTIQTALRGGGWIVGLNAPREVIRQVGKAGIEGLTPEQRATLPSRLHTDDPTYEKLMNLLLSVHSAFDPRFLRRVFEAQVARDDTMADALLKGLRSRQPAGGKKPLAVTITGAGHIQYGLGTPDRVQWREPGLEARILLLSESGDLTLSPAEKSMRRDVDFHHRDFLFTRRPVGDYVHVTEWNPATTENQ